MIRCPFTGCADTVALNLGMCNRHWRMLTSAEKTRFLDAWNQWRKGRMDEDQLKLLHAHLTEHTEGRLANA